METECKSESYEFQGLLRKKVIGSFTGGDITSDGGGLLIREYSERTGILKRFSNCFEDFRQATRIEHPVEDLIKQRVLGIVLGYGDLNDHQYLRCDRGFATIVGKVDVEGKDRKRERDLGAALASDTTLNRLELTPAATSAEARYKKIRYHSGKIEEFFVDEFIRSYRRAPKEIVLDFDTKAAELHGHQEGRFFHGYYDCYCYLPLYVFCGDHLLCSKLQMSNRKACAGADDVLSCIVTQIRAAWPKVKIIVRADSGFGDEDFMRACEELKIDYVLGLKKNNRLITKIEAELKEAEKLSEQRGEAVRIFKEIRYRTLDSWTKSRRVVAKAEHLLKGTNPRFVVTSLGAQCWPGRKLYEDLYCARGDMENRIKEQIPLFAFRVSAETMRANQLRLWFASVAYVLFSGFRRTALHDTELEVAQVETIRNKLFKIGARITISVRRICFLFASGFPYQDIFNRAFHRITQIQV